MSHLYISDLPSWNREKPYVVLQVGVGWWHRFMSPAFASLAEAVAWATDFCEKAASPFSLLKKDELPGWFQSAKNPQTWESS